MITLYEAEKLLIESEKMNPGPWINHSKNVALAAQKIAREGKKHDPEKAYIYGLLHDIGRRNGFSHIKHVYDGYIFMKEIDLLSSEICLSHTFPNRNIYEYQGELDIEIEKQNEIQTKISEMDYSFFHKLIILCDGYGFINGFISLEKRWIDAALRLGINEYTIQKWKKMYEIKKEIELENNIDIEEVLGIYS